MITKKKLNGNKNLLSYVWTKLMKNVHEHISLFENSTVFFKHGKIICMLHITKNKR